MKNLFWVFIVSLAFCGCKQDEPTPAEKPFQWVVKDNALTYNYYSPSDTTLNAMTLTVVINPGNSNLRFKFTYPQWSSIPGDKWIGDDYNVYRNEDGLYTTAYMSCGSQAPLAQTFEFVRAPLEPVINNYYPDYWCQNSVRTAYRVTSVASTLNVPLGTYATYVLQDTASNTNEYWSEENGIIKFELFDDNGVLSGSYELAAKNF